MGMDRLGQVVYVDSQQYQNQAGHHLQQQPQHSHQHHTQAPTKQQSQHPWISTTTIQSITPDQFLGSGFDWITGMSDLGTPSSSKATHSRGTNGSGATPPTSNVSTLDTTSSTTAGAKVSPQSFSAMGLTGLELTTLASGSCNTSGRQDPMASTFDLKSAHNEPTADSTGGEARQQRSKDQRDSNFTLSVSAAMPPVIRKTQELTGSSPQPAQPPTPLSPMAAFPDSQSAEHTFQRTNITMKQETSNMERISATPGSTLPRSLSTSAPTQEIASSTSWYDMVPMPSPTKPTAAPPHHHKVLSATSQDSRVTGSGGIWGGHHAINISSPMPKSTVHARRSSNNSSGSTSHIISSLSIQSAPRREAFVADPDVPASNTDTDSVTGLQRTTSVSSKGTTPDIDATADPLAAMNLTTRSASDPNEAALTASIGEEDGSDNENGRPARCPHCNKEFQSKGLLRSHVVSHSSDRPFVCWDCTDKSYKRNHDLLRHRREKHNIDGAIVPSRGSSRSHNGMSRDGTSDRSSKPPTLASQPQFAHQDLMYGPNSGVMYLGNTGPPLSDLSSPSSGSPLDPYNGVSYGQHQHGSSFYPSHPRNRPGLGLGLGLDNFGMKEFPTGLSLVASSGGAGGRSFDSGRRSSRGNFMGASIAGASANGRKRKFSNSNSTTPALIPPTAMAIMPPPAPAASGYTVSAVPSVSQPYNQLQHAGISNAFGNINAHTDQMGGLP
ncbi:hypothetical protein EDD11_001934 [Mortierella claussenii]|nr:hypothetical protein EDD11_001934 [Mortierella claussenii]